MGIRSTLEICRDSAVARIEYIRKLVLDGDFREIELNSGESDYSLGAFARVRVWAREADGSDVSKWSNQMLEDAMDLEFVRYDQFSNYTIT